jgi:hypothetical protein
LPWYFEYFLHSCRENPSVNFKIITDDYSWNSQLPENTELIFKSFNEIKNLIIKKLKLQIALEHPYKICDFRPTFGVVFSELISGYSFWGMGDIDVIFGNIRKFITDEILRDYDVISVRHDFLVGYFTLFRNCTLVNTLYKRSKDFELVFTKSQNFCFDESNYAYLKMDVDVAFEEVKCEIESMTHVVKKMHSQNFINAYFDVHAIEGLPGKLKWKNGTLIYKGRYEIILYHLIQFKENGIVPNKRKIPSVFRISQTRIY